MLHNFLKELHYSHVYFKTPMVFVLLQARRLANDFIGIGIN